MSHSRALTALAVVLILGACSDSQSPSGPAADNELTLQLDLSSGAVAEELAADEAAAAQLGTGGKGKARGVGAQVVSCVRNRVHEFCVDIRSGRIRRAAAEATATRNVNRTRGQIRLNGVLRAFTNRFGPVFRGDDLFANYPRLNIRVFRGDRICHQFPQATTQVCGVIR
jgi:hypothetical protein